MLDVYLEDDATVSVISREKRINCDICNQEAFIFQEEGNFCLNCWQDRTEPNSPKEGYKELIAGSLNLLMYKSDTLHEI